VKTQTQEGINNLLLKQCSLEGIFYKKFSSIDPKKKVFKNINEFNKELIKNNVDFDDYNEYIEFLEFFKIDIKEKNLINIKQITEEEKKKIEGNNNIQIIHKRITGYKEEKDDKGNIKEKDYETPNNIFLSNPNGGKTSYIKKLENIYPFFELNCQNVDNTVESKRHLFYKTHNDKLVIGNIIKAIANAIFNPDIPHYIYVDEIGSFKLDYIFGSSLKSILKKNQRVDLSNERIKKLIEKYNPSKKDSFDLSLDEFQTLCSEIKENEKNYKFTTYIEDGLSLNLFIPNNIFFICSANYEEGILESLNPLSGWEESGERFNIVHFYNFLYKDKINNDEKYHDIQIIDNLNEEIQEIINNNKNNDLSSETIKILQENEYSLYIPNYFPKKNNMKVYLEENLRNMYIDESDIEDIKNNIE